MTALAPTLQAFFTDRLINQRHASPHTIAAYRDTLRLLLRFAAEHAGTPPSDLDISDLDAPLIGAFLDHLEHERDNSVRTRNARLAAIRSLFHYAALNHPEHAATIQRVLSIPPKRFDRALVSFLTEPELDALLNAPDGATWTGRRDHALILLAAQTGLRVSELIGLGCADVHLGHGLHTATEVLLGRGERSPIQRGDPSGIQRRRSPLLSGLAHHVRRPVEADVGRDAHAANPRHGQSQLLGLHLEVRHHDARRGGEPELNLHVTVGTQVDRLDQAHIVESHRHPVGDAARVTDRVQLAADLRLHSRVPCGCRPCLGGCHHTGATGPCDRPRSATNGVMTASAMLVVEYGSGSRESCVLENSSSLIPSASAAMSKP